VPNTNVTQRLDIDDGGGDYVSHRSRDGRSGSYRCGTGSFSAAASTRVTGGLVLALLGEVGGEPGIAGGNSVDRRWSGSRLGNGDGDRTRGDGLSDGRGESRRGRRASQICSTVPQMLRIDIHSLPCSFNSSFAVVLVACAGLSGGDSNGGEGDDGDDTSEHSCSALRVFHKLLWQIGESMSWERYEREPGGSRSSLYTLTWVIPDTYLGQLDPRGGTIFETRTPIRGIALDPVCLYLIARNIPSSSRMDVSLIARDIAQRTDLA